MQRKIYDLQSLDSEIARLRLKAKSLESTLDDSFSYLQEHSSSLLMNTLLSGMVNKDTLTGSIIRLIAQNEKLQKTLGELAEILIDKLAGALDFLISKIPRKND